MRACHIGMCTIVCTKMCALVTILVEKIMMYNSWCKKI